MGVVVLWVEVMLVVVLVCGVLCRIGCEGWVIGGVGV